MIGVLSLDGHVLPFLNTDHSLGCDTGEQTVKSMFGGEGSGASEDIYGDIEGVAVGCFVIGSDSTGSDSHDWGDKCGRGIKYVMFLIWSWFSKKSGGKKKK